MANVSKVISVLEEVADKLKSGQTTTSSTLSSSVDQGASSRALSNRSEPRNLSRATASTNVNTQVGRMDFR